MAKAAKKPTPSPEPTAAPAEGHNLIGVDRNDFDGWSARHSAATEELKVAQAKRNKIRKAMRAAGIILGVFDRTAKLVDMSREEQQTEFVHTEAYLKWHRAPIGQQFSLILVSNDAFDDDDEGAAALIVEDAKGAGWRAGRDGKWEDVNPHPANSEAGQAWLGAYREGQEKKTLALGGDNADSGS